MTIPSCSDTVLQVSAIQATVDLAGSSTPTEIDLDAEELGASVQVYVSEDFYWTIADSASSGNTRLGSDSTRCKYPAGVLTLGIAGIPEGRNLYLKSVSGSSVTDGVAYTIFRGTRQ